MVPICETERFDAAQAHEEGEKAKRLLKEGALSAASSRLEQSLLCAGTALGHDGRLAIERLRDLADFNDGINNHASTLGAAADACMKRRGRDVCKDSEGVGVLALLMCARPVIQVSTASQQVQ